jgi:L-fucose isomerase-like protein
MQKPSVAFIPIARTTFDIKLAESVTQAARTHLMHAGLDLIGPETLITDLESARGAAELMTAAAPDLLVIFQATFADSSMVMALVETVDAPVFLWAVPEDHTGGRLRLNSFCGINLAGHAMTRAGYRYDFVFAAPDDPAVLRKIIPLAKAGHTRNLLRQSRLGRVGENPEGFETCLLDKEAIKTLFGLEVVQFELEKDIFPQAKAVGPEKVEHIYSQLNGRVAGLDDLEPTATRKTLSVYAALSQIAEQQKLGGYAVRCWPEFFTEMGCAACGALSMLSDEMTPCSCEADVNGTITQMILGSLSGEPTFGTDMVSIDEERDALVIWHCGLAPLSMADPEEQSGVTIHSNRKLPLLFEFSLKPGTVTIARLTESSGEYRLVIGSGKVVRGPKSFSGTSGLIQFERSAHEVLDLILREGLEHHISLTYGDHIPALIALANLLNLPILNLSEKQKG